MFTVFLYLLVLQLFSSCRICVLLHWSCGTSRGEAGTWFVTDTSEVSSGSHYRCAASHFFVFRVNVSVNLARIGGLYAYEALESTDGTSVTVPSAIMVVRGESGRPCIVGFLFPLRTCPVWSQLNGSLAPFSAQR